MSAATTELQSANLPNLSEEERARIAEAVMDPVLFSTVFLATHCWETQQQIMREIAKPFSRVAVKACHSSSKTFTAAIVLLWFLARYTESIVVTTAPTWNQVEKLLWGEVHSGLIRSKYPFPKANQTELWLGPKRYAQGLATTVTKQDEGVKFQGYHAQQVLMILDEAPGVDPKIWEAIEGARAGGDVRILAIGNPTISSGPFFESFTKNRVGWKTFTIDAFDTPNFSGVPEKESESDERDEVTRFIDKGKADPDWLNDNPLPFLTTKRWVFEKYFEWGPGHPLWEARVRGRFPKQAPDALLSLDWLEKAKIKEGVVTKKYRAGLDVAGPGEDETVLTVVSGETIVLQKYWPIPDPRGEVVRELQPFKADLESFNIDSIGVGWGIYLHMKDIFNIPGCSVNAVNICEAAEDTELFADCKAEYYWGLRLRLQNGNMSGMYNGETTLDEKTIGQLAGIRWKTNSRGQIEIESKEEAAKRGVKSPDRAESVMLAFAKRDIVFGVLELGREKRMEKVQTSSMQKPNQGDQKLLCPNCNADCVSRSQGQWRCNQCGHQFNTKGDRVVIERPKGRGGVFAKVR